MRGRRVCGVAALTVTFAPTLTLPACSRRATNEPASAVASASASDPAPAIAPAQALAPDTAPASGPAPASAGLAGTAPAGEARRTTLPRLESDPLLASHLGTLRDHFGSGAHGPFESQRVDLAGGRTAFLVTRADEGEPFVLAVDRDLLLWSKPRPVAGIIPPVRHFALAPRSDGGAVLFAWVASLHLVAARMWADDGEAFGDFELFASSACDALSVAYGPGSGWVVVCTSRAAGAGATQGAGATRAQRLREDGRDAWSHDGLALGSASATGPATIAFDTPTTFVVVAQAAGVGGDHVLAYRYGLDGEPLWAAPVDLGAVTRGATSSGTGVSGSGAAARLAASVARPGVVTIDLPRPLAGKSGPRVAELRSSGDVTISRP